VPVGRIGDAWGVKGGFKVTPFSPDPQALFSCRRWFLQPPPSRPSKSLPAVLRITAARSHGDTVVAQAQEVGDRTAAEQLRGATVFVARSSFPTTGDDEFYWVDLIGLEVINREGAVLGVVDSLLDTGAHSVLRVLHGDEERLIPFVAAYVDTVDLQGRRIVVDWGLDY
jgi:16S rRNA processing protein RimM